MRNDAFVDLRGQTDKGRTPYGVNLPVLCFTCAKRLQKNFTVFCVIVLK